MATSAVPRSVDELNAWGGLKGADIANITEISPATVSRWKAGGGDYAAAAQCSRSGSSWDDGTFDVLYTSQAKEGATEEMRFHLMRGQPVMPSKTRYKLFEICLVFQRVLKFVDLAALQKLGLKSAGYGQLSYQEKQAEHPRYQEIGEMAYFLGYDGLLVPSTRHRSMNVIIFCDRVPPQDTTVKKDYRKVNWN